MSISDHDVAALSGDEAFVLLALRYLDNLTTAEENELLRVQLANHAERRQTFVNLACRHGMLGELAVLSAEESTPVTHTAARSVSFSAILRRSLIPLIAAAGFMIMFSIFHHGRQQRVLSGLSVQVAEVRGRGDVWLPSGTQAASPGMWLSPGEALSTATNGAISLRYRDGSTIMLGSSSLLNLPGQTAESGKQLVLSKGFLSATVAKQPAGAPMVFSMPHARATVVGTMLTVAVTPAQTEVRVTEGLVRVADPAGGQVIELSAGEQATATFEAVRRDVPVPSSVPLWERGFNETNMALVGIGTVRVLEGPSGRLVAAASVGFKAEPGDAAWRPDQCVSTDPLPGESALFTVTDDTFLVLRLKAERTGAMAVTVERADPLIRKEHGCSREFPIDPGWKDVTVRLADLEPYRTSRPFRSGDRVATICVWGFGAGTIFLEKIAAYGGVKPSNHEP